MREAQEILEWYVAAGVDTLLEDAPVNRFTEEPPAPRKLDTSASSTGTSAVEKHLQKSAATSKPTSPEPARTAEIVLPDGNAVEQARAIAAEAKTLKQLQRAIASFDGCNLKRAAKNMVFADGNPEASAMIVGEPPDRDEDNQGQPFVGQAGFLFDRMLSSIGLDRESVYLTTVLPWRPPGNRPPTPQETEICRPFIERHIELIGPTVLVLMGGLSAKTLLNAETNITRLRGKWVDLTINGLTVPTIATLHPAYLMQQRNQKKLAWQDLLAIQQRLENKA